MALERQTAGARRHIAERRPRIERDANMAKANDEETITITLQRSTLDCLFAGGNNSLGTTPLSQTLALNVVDHAAWLADIIAGQDCAYDQDHYAARQREAAREIIDAVAAAERRAEAS